MIVIVGHGPSLKGAKRGKEIDEYDVVRLKHFKRFHDEEDYGTKTDYLCASTEAAMGMLSNQVKVKEYWLYPKMGKYDQNIHKVFKDTKYTVPLEETEYWNDKFKLATGYHPGLGAYGRNVSTGLAAIIICAYHLKPEKIHLIGFDTLLDPSIEYESVFNPGTKHKNMHFWAIENTFLPEIEEKYEVEIVGI